MSQPCRLGVIVQEDENDYRAKARKYLSSHQLKDFRKSPLLYWRKREGLIKDEDKPAYQLGRAAHKLILEGREAFQQNYIVGGPVNAKTGEAFGVRTKTYQEWAAKQEREVLSPEQSDVIERMYMATAHQHDAVKLLSEGIAEGVVRASYCGRACQTRMDWLNPERGIVDLKTCDDLDWFEFDVRKYGYIHQLAFYRAILKQVIGNYAPVHLIAVEKREPFRCGIWKLGEEALGVAQQENESAIKQLLECEAKDFWPTGYAEVRALEFI